MVRLKDVARVEFGSKDYTYEAKVNGHPAAGFAVKLTNDANALETVGNVKKVLDEASKNFPEGMKYKTVIDSTKFISESMIEVAKTFAEALLLVVLVYSSSCRAHGLRSSLCWRYRYRDRHLWPVVVMGFTINTLTLFAMVLAIAWWSTTPLSSSRRWSIICATRA